MEKKILIAVIIVMVLTMMTGCHREFSKLNKRVSTTQKAYSLTDSSTIKNYILYNSQAHNSFSLNSKPIPINEDSVMQVVLKSFEKLDLPIDYQLKKGKNQIDSIFYRDYLIKIRKIDENWIKNVAGYHKNSLTIVPLIYIHNRITFTGFISSGGMAGNNGFHVMSFVNVILYIVDDDEIIYSRQVMHSSERTWADSRAEAEAIPPAPLVTQDVWDELVRLAMKDYIKRLK